MKRSNGNGRTETGRGSFYGQLVGNLKSGGGLMGRAEPGMEGVQNSSKTGVLIGIVLPAWKNFY